MTIDHFYITAGYAVWIYTLLCICVKLFMDRKSHRHRKDQKQRNAVDFFFDAGKICEEKNRKKIEKYAEDDLIFDYICERYMEKMKDETEKKQFEEEILRIVHKKIRTLKKDDAMSRCLLMNNISRCSLTSEEIKNFLKQCRKASCLETMWIECREEEQQLEAAG